MDMCTYNKNTIAKNLCIVRCISIYTNIYTELNIVIVVSCSLHSTGPVDIENGLLYSYGYISSPTYFTDSSNDGDADGIHGCGMKKKSVEKCGVDRKG